MAAEIKRAKFYKIQAIGVAVIMGMVFLSSLTVALRILQSQSIQQVKVKLGQSEQKVLNLKDRQVSLILLKNRLTVINQYLGTSSKQTAIYRLLDKLLPQSLVINSLTVDKTGDIILTGATIDSSSIDTLVESLLDKETNEDKVSQVAVESINRGRDGLYRISLKIKSK